MHAVRDPHVALPRRGASLPLTRRRRSPHPIPEGLPVMRGVKVTPEIKAEICRLYTEECLSTGRIAAEVGLSRVSIGAVLKRNDIARDLSRRGFAVICPDRQRSIASVGGKSVPADKRTFSRDRVAASRSGRKGGSRAAQNGHGG